MDILLACLLTLGMDHAQTLDIRHHRGMYETSPYLGRHPGDGTVNSYFAALSVWYVSLHYAAPKEISSVAEIMCVTTHGEAVQSNIGIGLNFRIN